MQRRRRQSLDSQWQDCFPNPRHGLQLRRPDRERSTDLSN
ncbi:unnamed protein product [Linum tenue]|uniref:Uncharacterized protein n=1 Tax=Linum tenue TaxID=586396 RepID=A0AAV0H3R4_9ROSI|nr:unnamed protein product [Linum tenue]